MISIAKLQRHSVAAVPPMRDLLTINNSTMAILHSRMGIARGPINNHIFVGGTACSGRCEFRARAMGNPSHLGGCGV